MEWISLNFECPWGLVSKQISKRIKVQIYNGLDYVIKQDWVTKIYWVCFERYLPCLEA